MRVKGPPPPVSKLRMASAPTSARPSARRSSALRGDQAIAMLRDPKRGFLSFETWTAWGRRAA
jgi:hypothetical protein